MQTSERIPALDQETNQEVLRACCYWLSDEVDYWKKKAKDKENEDALKKQLGLQIADKLVTLKRLIFGKSSEKRNVNREERKKGEEAFTLHAQSLIPEPASKKETNIGEEVVMHETTKDELNVEGKSLQIEGEFEEIKGLYEESTEITVIERVYKKIRHKRKKYRFVPKNKGELDKEIIITSDFKTPKLIPGSSYSIDFALSVVRDKFLYHLPLERQTRQMEEANLFGVTPKTLYNLSGIVGIYLEPIAKKIKEEVLSHKIALHMDETPWPITNGRDDSGYMYILSNQKGSHYEFQNKRNSKIVESILKGFEGNILTDGLSSYQKLKKNKKITLSHCHSHARRKFVDIEENYPSEVKEYLDIIAPLFEIEKRAKDFEELKILREKESAPIIDKLRRWLIEMLPKSRPESALRGAINYQLKYWDGLTKFLKDPLIPLTNNDAERGLRQAVMGRKNFYGSRSIDSADLTAVFYTLIESCKKVQINPTKYMKYVILETQKNNEKAPLSPYEFALTQLQPIQQ